MEPELIPPPLFTTYSASNFAWNVGVTKLPDGTIAKVLVFIVGTTRFEFALPNEAALELAARLSIIVPSGGS